MIAAPRCLNARQSGMRSLPNASGRRRRRPGRLLRRSVRRRRRRPGRLLKRSVRRRRRRPGRLNVGSRPLVRVQQQQRLLRLQPAHLLRLFPLPQLLHRLLPQLLHRLLPQLLHRLLPHLHLYPLSTMTGRRDTASAVRWTSAQTRLMWITPSQNFYKPRKQQWF